MNKIDRRSYQKKLEENSFIIESLLNHNDKSTANMLLFPEKAHGLRFSNAYLDLLLEIEDYKLSVISGRAEEIPTEENVALKLLVATTRKELNGSLLSKEEFSEMFGDLKDDAYLAFIAKLICNMNYAIYGYFDDSYEYYCSEIGIDSNIGFYKNLFLMSSQGLITEMIKPLINFDENDDEDVIENIETLVEVVRKEKKNLVKEGDTITSSIIKELIKDRRNNKHLDY